MPDDGVKLSSANIKRSTELQDEVFELNVVPLDGQVKREQADSLAHAHDVDVQDCDVVSIQPVPRYPRGRLEPGDGQRLSQPSFELLCVY
jgi:hypothetical protein